MKGIFIDGTFKYCPKYFYQLYSLHGCKNGNAIALVFALLPAKSEDCYIKMWDLQQNNPRCHLLVKMLVQKKIVSHFPISDDLSLYSTLKPTA
jgi:hypothetical protein